MRLLGLLLFITLSISGFCQQPGYNLQFKIAGLKDTTAYLGYYWGESTYVKDTARVNSKGEFAFDGKESLPQGVYMIVLEKTKIFDMVIGSTQRFKIETSTEDYGKHMKVTGDPDNKLFFENMLFERERYTEAEPFRKVIQDSTLAESDKKEAREAFNKVYQKVMDYQDGIITKHPTTVTARISKVNKPIKIPDPPKRADGSIDSTFQLRWYRQHFFDNLDLGDDAFIRLPRPVYKEKVYEYLDKLYVPHPDTVIKALDGLIAKAKRNQETYKYLVFISILKYQTPEIMGLDGVFVHLYDKYFATGQMDFWANAKFKENLKDHADQLRKSLLGKTAPNLIMQDVDFKLRSMHAIPNKYTILFFFDPDCGHCKTETPKLVDFYTKNKTKLNVEVYAVSADTSMTKLRDYIKTMNMKGITVCGPRSATGSYHDLYDAKTTPTLYVLDEKKKIIGKKLPIEKLEEFIINHERINRKKPGQP